MEQQKLNNVPQPSKTEEKAIAVERIIASLNHAQRAALVGKYEAYKKPIKDALVSKFPEMSNLERYIAGKALDEANAKIVSDKMPAWRGTLHTFAPDLESKNETLKKAAESRLESLKDEVDASDSITALLKWYKIKRDMSSNDDHIKLVCAFFGTESSAIA